MTPDPKSAEELRKKFEDETGDDAIVPSIGLVTNEYLVWLESDNLRLRSRLEEAEKEKVTANQLIEQLRYELEKRVTP